MLYAISDMFILVPVQNITMAECLHVSGQAPSKFMLDTPRASIMVSMMIPGGMNPWRYWRYESLNPFMNPWRYSRAIQEYLDADGGRRPAYTVHFSERWPALQRALNTPGRACHPCSEHCKGRKISVLWADHLSKGRSKNEIIFQGVSAT